MEGIQHLEPQSVQEILKIYTTYPVEINRFPNGMWSIGRDSVYKTSQELYNCGLNLLGFGKHKAVYEIEGNDTTVLSLLFEPINQDFFRYIHGLNLIAESLSPHVPHMYGDPIVNDEGLVVGIYKQKVKGKSTKDAQSVIGEGIRTVHRLYQEGKNQAEIIPDLEIFVTAYELITLGEKYHFSITLEDGVEEQWMLGDDGMPFYVDEFFSVYDRQSNEWNYAYVPNLELMINDIKSKPNSEENLKKLVEGWRLLFPSGFSDQKAISDPLEQLISSIST